MPLSRIRVLPEAGLKSEKSSREKKLFYYELDMNECRASLGQFLNLTLDAFDNLQVYRVLFL